MGLTYDFYYNADAGGQSRTIYFHQGEDVPKGVLERFFYYFKEHPEEIMYLNEGQHKTLRSSYDNEYYNIYREKVYSFVVEK